MPEADWKVGLSWWKGTNLSRPLERDALKRKKQEGVLISKREIGEQSFQVVTALIGIGCGVTGEYGKLLPSPFKIIVTLQHCASENFGSVGDYHNEIIVRCATK